RERKNYNAALELVQQLAAKDPLNSSYFQLIAELNSEKQDYTALAEQYKQGLKNVRESDMTPEEKKQKAIELRRGIIQADIISKDYTAALDQYIEIINVTAEDTSVLQEAADFGSRYGIFPRLVEYYQKTAAASPRDHRWPMVLGRLHVFSGEFEQAAKDF